MAKPHLSIEPPLRNRRSGQMLPSSSAWKLLAE
jgi:hypothetical protein